MPYTKEDLHYGEFTDTGTDNYDEGVGFWLEHRCSEWVIGDIEDAKRLIANLQERIQELKSTACLCTAEYQVDCESHRFKLSPPKEQSHE